MTNVDFFKKIIVAELIEELEEVLHDYYSSNSASLKWTPFGGRDNNRGIIEVASDPGRSLIERLTNGIDAILELQFHLHNGKPECKSPKMAATTWLNIPTNGLSEMSTSDRRELAKKVEIKLLNGEDRNSRTVEIRDKGVGISPEDMKKTILSLNESNKITKYYLAGAYGQGGSSTLASCKYVFIASRTSDSKVGFTLAKYEDLPAEDFKTGRYVYLVQNDEVIIADIPIEEFVQGTLVKHYGYDLSSYSQVIGPNSVYGLLNQILFDPVLPVWFDNNIREQRRVIKGSRNSLNGAVDEGDDNVKGTNLSHKINMFFTSIAEYGRIGVEYWVMEKPTSSNRKPTAVFVNPNKPIILTLNGQNHGELPQSIIRKDAELPYLAQRLIFHVDCNNLTPVGKRQLLVSNREGLRKGIVSDLIINEVIKILKSDDDLIRLNNEAREQGLKEKDHDALKTMKIEVAKILKMQGMNIGLDFGLQSTGNSDSPGTPSGNSKPRPKPKPIELHDPPTYIKILWPEDKDITFYPDQRRYIRVETDANSNYFNAIDFSSSKINIISNGDLIYRGATPLENGRMRIIFQAKEDSKIDSSAEIKIELSRPGLPILTDQRKVKIIEIPPVKTAKSTISLPPFDIIPVEGPNDEKWIGLAWPEDVKTIASSSEMENGTLNIYYSKVFPKFADQYKSLEIKDTSLAESFISRYEVWLIVHSLLLFHDQQQDNKKDTVDDSQEINETEERKERCRLATIASMIASREVSVPSSIIEE